MSKPNKIAEALAHAREFAAAWREEFPDDEDDGLKQSTLESIGDVAELVERLTRAALKRARLAQMTAEECADLAAREARFRKQVDRLKSLIVVIMGAAELKSLEFPVATVTYRAGAPIAFALDPALTPREFKTDPKPPEPVPNKRLILECLKAGEAVPGWTLGRAEPFLQVKAS